MHFTLKATPRFFVAVAWLLALEAEIAFLAAAYPKDMSDVLAFVKAVCRL